MSRRAVIAIAAKLAFSAGLLSLVLAKVDPRPVLAILARADLPLVLVWYALVPVVIALSAWRWRILAPGMSYGIALKYTWIGLFYSHVLPGSIAGDIAKGVSLAIRDSTARAGLAASIVAEKAIGLLALLLFFDAACAVVFVLYGDATPEIRHLSALALVLSIGGAMGILIAAAIALRGDALAATARHPLLRRAAENVGAAARFYRERPGRLAKAFLISAMIHVVNIVSTYLSFRALRIEGDFLLATIVYPVLSVILLVPISISGIGVRDATLAVLFTLFGFAAASGVALSWLTLLAIIPNIAIGGTIQLLEMYRRP